MLDKLLPANEYLAVMETVEEEIAALERLADEDGLELEATRHADLVSAAAKLAPERSRDREDFDLSPKPGLTQLGDRGYE
jgi:hypothetical protein